MLMVADAARQLLDEATVEWQRLRRLADYHRGHHALPYHPKKFTPEFEVLARRSRTNLLPNVVSTLVDRLYVDGFRPDTAEDAVDSPVWSWWQANGMDSRQSMLYELAARYGYAYVMVMPGETGVPWMRPKSPRTWYAHFESQDDDWPTVAVRQGSGQVELVDADTVTVLSQDSVDGRLSVESVQPHGLGVVPLVRYQNSWPDEGHWPQGEVEKLIDVQDRLNQTVFDLMVTQTFLGSPQQWIAGLVADADDKIKAMAKRVWTFDSPATQVGQLPQADLRMLISAIENAIRMFGIKAQMPPNYLLGEMVQVSAEALVAAHADLDAKVEARQQMHGESHERMFRLAARAAGESFTEQDESAQVVWRRTDPRSLASTVDALGKMVQMLGIPADEVWPMIPGVSQQDVARWRQRQSELDPMVLLDREIGRMERAASSE